MSANLIQTIQDTRDKFETVSPEKREELLDILMLLTKKLTSQLADFSQIPENFIEDYHPRFEMQLKAAEKRTDEGIDKIMGAAESIMSTCGTLASGEKDKIMEQVNVIFEASSMQDLVAQHLNEMKILMDEMKEDFEIFSSVLSDTDGKATEGAYKRLKSQKEKRPDKHLLNGPSTDF